jgi:hypothetical protein
MSEEARTKSVADFFGCDVFNDAAMRERLPKSVYKKLTKTIEDGDELDPGNCGCRGACHEGMGNRARCDAFHALVPAAYRCHGGKA